ncbi:MAG: LytTR family DNA-binding domain-containing protein [Candidatus Pedobacter colombiensis]|uniref:LytTR family DNA-binding domain-containing protein n=1 Tax=Candidatus Pedobacter colombiensis TaxID=3121371 RepID=A0AAJ6B5W2_9SPHI|nr:LytTR family DNA-binding domain-containing protein [Pedobacter sp.]WEK17911.1 MAG: LytTR family DNA-binding domain-containing protein [Pedobacter sp.]
METVTSGPVRPHKNFEKLLRIFLAIIAAHYIVVNGTDYNLLKLLINKNYYFEMAFSVLVALLLVTWISAVSFRLDKRLGWNRQTVPERSLFQFLLGVALPLFAEFIFIVAYFWFGARINVLKTNFMNTEFRLVIFLILFFNLYCIARYFYYKQHIAELELEHYKQQFPVQALQEPLPENGSTGQDTRYAPETENNKREIFIVNTTLRSIPVRIEEICSFYRASGCYYLRTYEQSINDAFVIPQTLKEVEELLDQNQFFRINRQMIVSFKSCVSFRPGKGKMLELIVEPKHIDENGTTLDSVSVSEDRVQAFKAWMDR